MQNYVKNKFKRVVWDYKSQLTDLNHSDIVSF
jgi:hypothetical protein